MAKKKNVSKDQRLKQREKEKKKKRQTWLIMMSTLVVLLLVVLIVGIVIQNKQKVKTDQTGNSGTSTPTTSSVIQYKNEPAMGKADAPIKLAEFGDYKCPICQAFELQVFPQLKKDFIDTGKVQFYFMNYPIIAQDSVLAANASETIYEEHSADFWKFHELLYENQGDETKNWVTQDLLTKIAKQAVPSLDEKAFKWSLAQSSYKDQVDRDTLMGQRAGVQGTPTLFINGVMTKGSPLDYEALKQQINQALNKIQK
ncbi:thioredoxin domain-containing protein [Pullulanibacillus sp. KACC 23026]|uniref:DsbA family protein n=1 Tax=Pullulanibacillus sp. KACC 23026 TaxID=3028315 RepID=UPI0023B18F40|nr:thioredoxin domain-containing protein [Pullulanibacillus sp. KACC 23026]WEG12544.1 thioredoxin domain-containing protein [Pullulanibacillus sp. KACC 23026]